MGDDRQVKGLRHRRDLLCFGNAAHPAEVGLQQIEIAAGNQLAKTVAGVLVLAGGKSLPGTGGFDLCVPVVVVG